MERHGQLMTLMLADFECCTRRHLGTIAGGFPRSQPG